MQPTGVGARRMLGLGVPGSTDVLPTQPCACVDKISREPEHRVNAWGPLDRQPTAPLRAGIHGSETRRTTCPLWPLG